jgi:hypothetical protein
MLFQNILRTLYLVKTKRKYGNDLVEYAIEVHDNIENFAKRFNKNYFTINGHYLIGEYKAKSFDKALRIRYMARTGCFPIEEVISNLRETIWLYMNWFNKEKRDLQLKCKHGGRKISNDD